MNNLYQELQSSQFSPQEEQLRSMMQEFKSAPNKHQYLQNMLTQNPALRNIQGVAGLLNGKLNESALRNMFIKSAQAQGLDPQRMMTVFGLQ